MHAPAFAQRSLCACAGRLGALAVYGCVMTAQSIDAGDGGEYARYLEGKTQEPERGAYYLTPEGEPAQAPGRWLSDPQTLVTLGIEPGQVNGPDFVALMEGRHPQTGRWLRPEGAGGGRGGGIDVVFSAPKSVSISWALADAEGRKAIEQAHSQAVSEAVAYMRERAPLVRRRIDGRVAEQTARDVLAAEYRHTTARGVDAEELPDPHLHSHVVVTSVIREDGRVVAVSSRAVFRAAREVGSFYRSALAAHLAEQGHQIVAHTGKHGRYFEIAGIGQDLRDAFSQRTREITAAAERFRAAHGRAPKRGELRRIKRDSRRAKKLIDKGDLDRAWRRIAERHLPAPEDRDGRTGDHRRPEEPGAQPDVERLIEHRLTERAATFTPEELRAVVLEQTTGRLAPRQALRFARQLTESRMIVPLHGGELTTLALRSREQQIQRHLVALAQPADRDTGDHARAHAAGETEERIGARLNRGQAEALTAITGPERAAILIGPAGTGKGVVIDTAARAEQLTGHDTYGIAVAGATAQRLARDSPALAGSTFTLDKLVTAAAHDRLQLDDQSTVYLDEAGTADTDRLAKLTETIERTGAKLVLIGDAAQLPSIAAGGMFGHIAKQLPTAELTEVLRTKDPAERRAWTHIRGGDADSAMAYYNERGRLRIEDTRDEAIERAAQHWASLLDRHDPSDLLLISGASNQETDRINARAQHLRLQRGELGDRELPIPNRHYAIRAGDRVSLTRQHHEPGAPRIENGSRGLVTGITHKGQAIIQFDLTGEQRVLQGEDLTAVRLAYAQHVHPAQGSTVENTLVVTGGWQTSAESAYVQATRARHTTTWFAAREDLGTEGEDTDRIARLSKLMENSRAQIPSIACLEITTPNGPAALIRDAPSPSRLPAAARTPAPGIDRLPSVPSVSTALSAPHTAAAAEHPLYETLHHRGPLTRALHALAGRTRTPQQDRPQPGREIERTR